MWLIKIQFGQTHVAQEEEHIGLVVIGGRERRQIVTGCIDIGLNVGRWVARNIETRKTVRAISKSDREQTNKNRFFKKL